MRESFARRDEPIISVDAKKKELIGNFKNGGRSWEKEAIPEYDHDFPSDAVGRVVPYGIYDTQANRGFICVGTSAETPAFAVDSIERWWKEQGQDRPRACGCRERQKGLHLPSTFVYTSYQGSKFCSPYHLPKRLAKFLLKAVNKR